MPQQDFSDAERQAIIRAKEMYSRAVPQNSGETVFRKQPNPSEADGRSAGFGSQNPGMNYNNSGYRQQNPETNTRNSGFQTQNPEFNSGARQNQRTEPFQDSGRQSGGNFGYRSSPRQQQRNDSRFFSNPMSFLSGFLNDPDAKLIIAMILLLSGDGGDNLLLMALIYIML